MYSFEPPHMAEQKPDDLHEHTFSNYVRIRDVALKTCRRRWTIGKSGERGSGISVQPARHDDDDDDDISMLLIWWKWINYLNVTDCWLFWRENYLLNGFYLHWALYQEYLNLIFYFWIFYWSWLELFPSPDLLDWINNIAYIYIYIYIYIYNKHDL